jgi:peptidyl-prolyl cis-trans isomerase B (cyclophilin B)
MLRLPLRLAVALACSLVVAACGGGDNGGGGGGEQAATATPAGSESTDTGCEKVAKPPAKSVKLPKPKTVLAAGRTYVATVSTSCGDFQITLDAKRAPKTGGSFAYMAKHHLYDNTPFHRVVNEPQNFVIQGGDPKGNGSGGPGYSIVEPPPKNLRYTKGVVAMAKTDFEDAGTSGSQFFVVTAEDAQLPPEYALVGKVTGGMDVVDKIAAVKTEQDEPVDPVVIKSVTVAES